MLLKDCKTDKQYLQVARMLKENMSSCRSNIKGSLKDIVILLKCNNKQDYKEVYQTKLYNKYSCEYCHYLQLLYELELK